MSDALFGFIIGVDIGLICGYIFRKVQEDDKEVKILEAKAQEVKNAE